MAKQVTGIRSGSIGLVVMLFFGAALLTKGHSNISAIILFGDSTLDVGNNNYLATLVKSNFRPYGRDLPSQMAAGRFSNGLLVPDFVAEDLGLTSPLAYLDPEAQGDKLLLGINFASAGSGWIDSTAELFLVRPFTQQIQDFQDYRNKLTELVGPTQAADIICNALYVVSSGSNDYVNNYFLTPLERERFTLPEWHNHIITSASQFLQEIYSAGARKFVVASVPAIGCLPAAISLYGEGSNQCVGYVNDAATAVNLGLQRTLASLQSSLPGVQILSLDIYNILLDAFQNPSTYGFEETREACCGTGTVEVAILCNADSPGTCSDASKYVFFDSFHGSQAFYWLVAQKARQAIISTFAS